MKKHLIIIGILTCTILQTQAGGLVTNSNQSAAYMRMMSRGVSTDADAVYYNPAGLAFLEDGLTISFNTQMIWMKRTITNDLQTLNQNKFEGNLFVPFFPGIYAAYKTGDWTFFGGFNPPAGGGSVEFKHGLPMLEAPVSMLKPMLTGNGITTTEYSMESMMKGSSIVYGAFAGAAYKINEMFGVSGGLRMMFASNSYEGYIRNIRINPLFPPLGNGVDMISASAFFTAIGQTANAAATADQSLDVKQSGSGVAPIFGVHFRPNQRSSIAVKYEFKTKITLENETKENAQNMYPDKQKLRSDVPALLSIAAGYDISSNVKASFTYLHHFEKQATLESWNAAANTIVQRQKLIDNNTTEVQLGIEWKLNDKLTLSTGCQVSTVGVSKAWQNDMSHNLTNTTVGLGFAYRVTEQLTVNFGAINTWYEPVTIKTKNTLPSPPFNEFVTQKYDRTNRAIAVGIDYRF
jgi:long-chain fatty acid transport protein